MDWAINLSMAPYQLNTTQYPTRIPWEKKKASIGLSFSAAQKLGFGLAWDKLLENAN